RMNVRGIGDQVTSNERWLGRLRDAIVLPDGKLATADTDRKCPHYDWYRLVDRPKEILEGGIDSEHAMAGPVPRFDVGNPRRDEVEGRPPDARIGQVKQYPLDMWIGN